MNDSFFIDTNILIYAHDVDAGAKHDRAVHLLRDLWSKRTGVLSTQVLTEFYVNVTRKIKKPLPRAIAKDIVERYSVWRVVQVEIQLIMRAVEIEERHQISFWDSLIVAAAQKSNALKLFTEDLNHGQSINGVIVENPFV